jgi:hypothetical protein
MTAEVERFGSSSSVWWLNFRDSFDALFTGPAIPPSGTYTAEVGADTYTFDNCDFSGAYTLEATDKIIYPVFHLNTYEAGDGLTYISTVEYKWQVVDGKAPRPATADEVKVAVGNYAIATGLISNQSPHIQFYPSEPVPPGTTCPVSYIYFDRDFPGSNGTLDLTTALINGSTFPPIKLSDVDRIKTAYTSSTNIQIEFWYGL